MEFLFIRDASLRCFHVNSGKFYEHLFVKQKRADAFETMFIWIQSNNFPNSNLMISIIRSRCPEMFKPATLLKKKLWHKFVPANFAKFLKALFLTEHLQWLLLFCDDWVLCFPSGGFLVFKFHENVDKLDRGNFKRGFTMAFKVKNL